jgi:transcriptional regulator with XRE-family HTH domain
MQFKTYLRQLGGNIKAARIRSGLKQIDVYNSSGVTYRHYQNIEAGKVNVTIETLHRLSRLFKVTIKDLVEDEEA